MSYHVKVFTRDRADLVRFGVSVKTTGVLTYKGKVFEVDPGWGHSGRGGDKPRPYAVCGWKMMQAAWCPARFERKTHHKWWATRVVCLGLV